MAVACVVLDFDNTLLLSEQCKHDTMREVAAQFEGGLDVLSAVPTDSRSAPLGAVVTRHTIFAGLASGLHARGVRPGPPSESSDAFGARMCSEFSQLLDTRLKVAAEVPGAVAALRHFNAHGLPCFVNTATPQEAIDQLVSDLGWGSLFAGVYGAPRTKVQNLEAAAAAVGGLPPARVVHVGDGDNDCRAAHAFGCSFVGIALDGGVGAFSAPVAAVVADMHGACAAVCALAQVPPP